jgi:hypothetical protein
MSTEHTGQIIRFINSIGIECRAGNVPEQTFLPGIYIAQGCIIFDPEQLKYPGDLLHEAGHLAIMPPALRACADGEKMEADLSAPGAEMTAIAWSWAAAGHLGIPAAVLFHKDGYRGGSESLIGNFSTGKYIGVPTLAWLGMTNEPKPHNEQPIQYPRLKHWLRQ